jgi:hypothetical protein
MSWAEISDPPADALRSQRSFNADSHCLLISFFLCQGQSGRVAHDCPECKGGAETEHGNELPHSPNILTWRVGRNWSAARGDHTLKDVSFSVQFYFEKLKQPCVRGTGRENGHYCTAVRSQAGHWFLYNKRKSAVIRLSTDSTEPYQKAKGMENFVRKQRYARIYQ